MEREERVRTVISERVSRRITNMLLPRGTVTCCVNLVRTEQPKSSSAEHPQAARNRLAAPGSADPSFLEARPSRSQTQYRN